MAAALAAGGQSSPTNASLGKVEVPGLSRQRSLHVSKATRVGLKRGESRENSKEEGETSASPEMITNEGKTKKCPPLLALTSPLPSIQTQQDCPAAALRLLVLAIATLLVVYSKATCQRSGMP